jgi:hypothetical protein
VLRALAEQSRHTDPSEAAALLRQARLLKGAEPALALEEARAWLATTTPGRSAVAFAAFVESHSDQAYAWTIVCDVVLNEAGIPSLLARVAARVGTPSAHFAAKVGAELASEISETTRLELLRDGIMLLRSTRAAHDRPLVEMALADLVAGHPVEALEVYNAGVSTMLAQYRIASTLESGASAARRVSREIFDGIARTVSDASIRAGAAFHLARLAHDSGATVIARQWARRCVALSPSHQAAAALLRQLELRKAS